MISTLKQGLRITMLTRRQERCGVSDYSRHLVTALKTLPEVAGVEIVEPPESAARRSALRALLGYAVEERRYRMLGAEMGRNGAAIAHVQHQYFFFGGVAPHKNHAKAFLDAVRLPLVLTVHEIALPSEGAKPVVRAALAYTNRTNLLHPRVRAWIVHTEQDRERLVGLGAPAERVHRVIHGVPDVPPLPDADEARRTLGLEGRRVLTLFGFLSTKKGHHIALDCLQGLPSDVALLFAGDQHPDDMTDYVPALRAAVKARGLEERVCITGYLTEEWIAYVMAATDIALAPYLQSSGSGSLANLLAYGCVVVASDIPPHCEIAADAPEILALFPSGDAGALAEQIRILLGDEAARSRYQANALAYAVRHSYREMARATLQIYRMLI